MIVDKYREMLGAKSVIRELSEYATARGKRLDMRMFLITVWGIHPYRRRRILRKR